VKQKELAEGTIIEKQQLNSVTKKITIYAPDIAAKARAGQFVILKVQPDSERIPLTLSSWSKKHGTITNIFQEVGIDKRTRKPRSRR